MTEYMILRGTGEDLTDNLPGRFLQPLLRPGDIVTHVAYPAAIGPVGAIQAGGLTSMTAAVAAGVEAVSKAVTRTPNVPVLVGYSLGAWVVSDYLESMARGHRGGQSVAGAIMIASPRAPKENGREGLAREHGRYPDVPVCEVRNWWDLICNTPSNSPLMKLTGLVAVATGGVGDGFDVMRWVMSELLRQSALPTRTDLRLLEGYASGKAHERDYLDNPEFRRFVHDWMSRHLG